MQRLMNNKDNKQQLPPVTPRPPERPDTIPIDPRNIINLNGVFETVEVAPTAAPRTFYESIKIVVDDLGTPTTYELYIYSRELGAWLKATLAVA